MGKHLCCLCGQFYFSNPVIRCDGFTLCSNCYERGYRLGRADGLVVVTWKLTVESYDSSRYMTMTKTLSRGDKFATEWDRSVDHAQTTTVDD